MAEHLHADTVVIGGGTAGAAVAARLVQGTSQKVLLIESGPDYGAFAEQCWPTQLLDARSLPGGHDWGYVNGANTGRPGHPLERARVIGGCSSHNGCAAIWGSRVDYDHWAALGNAGWSADELLPFFKLANETLRVKRISSSEITPWQQACLETAPKIGIPEVTDLNNLDEDIGMSTSPVNILDGVRWNTAFAYLDSVRGNDCLTIQSQIQVDRLQLEGNRVIAIEATGPDGPLTVKADRVVVCAGTYGSPAILLRSGIGPDSELRALGIETKLDLAVGRNLHDHPAVYLKFSGTPQLVTAMKDFAAKGGILFSEQTIAKFRSKYCTSAYDLHLFPVGGQFMDAADDWEFLLPVANMIPLSRGSVQLMSADPFAALKIDTAYLSDPEGRDLAILWNGIELVRDYARQAPLAELIGEEISPTVNYRTAEAVRRDNLHYYHPVGTCKMGPESDLTAVVDARGKVHGVDNLYVADASIMPVVPRANTNIPTLVVGERISAWLTQA
ncbi:MAG: GMC family oxidoreductase [Anaerolineae bacterium]|nr:GMC family oxidoreductase [Anaerolineae bacterium]MCI0608283.1 GMC family oxidoreductase [Anaerolineae bacterium]